MSFIISWIKIAAFIGTLYENKDLKVHDANTEVVLWMINCNFVYVLHNE